MSAPSTTLTGADWGEGAGVVGRTVRTDARDETRAYLTFYLGRCKCKMYCERSAIREVPQIRARYYISCLICNFTYDRYRGASEAVLATLAHMCAIEICQ